MLADTWPNLTTGQLRDELGVAPNWEVALTEQAVNEELARLNDPDTDFIKEFDGDKGAYMVAHAHAIEANNLIELWKSVPF